MNKIFARNYNNNFYGLRLFTPALAFILGHAGGDFIENIYKIIIKKSSLYQEK